MLLFIHTRTPRHSHHRLQRRAHSVIASSRPHHRLIFRHCSHSLSAANTLSVQLSKYPALNNFEKQTSVPKVYAVLGLAGLYFFLVFFNIAGAFLVNVAGFAIPGYYSLAALFSASKVDDTQVRMVVRGICRSFVSPDPANTFTVAHSTFSNAAFGVPPRSLLPRSAICEFHANAPAISTGSFLPS